MVFVLGSINVDLVLYSQKAPEAGETIVGKDFLMNQGGKGANQAIAVTKAGARTCFIGRVGDDFFGNFAVSKLESFGVEAKITIDRKALTGVALINVCGNGENRIVIFHGANEKVSEEELEYLEKSISPNDLLLIQGEIPLNALEKSIVIAKRKNALVVFDPSPARNDFRDIISNVDFVTPNEIELKSLTASNSVEDLLLRGAKNVILKLGNKGILYRSREKEFLVEAFKVKAIDTTGAGDTFNGAFAAALNCNCEVKEALIFASAAAAISVTRRGAGASSPYKEEILKFLEERSLRGCY